MTGRRDVTEPSPGAAGYRGRRVLVAGAGVAGAAAAKALLAASVEVTVVDQRDSEALAGLAAAGARVVVAPVPAAPAPAAGAPGGAAELPSEVARLLGEVTEVVVSPGFSPRHPLAAAAVKAGLDVYSEPELAWRLRGEEAPWWLAVTGTNGKTTTVTMLAAILRAAGARTAALGNIGEPLAGVSADRSAYDVLCVELSSFQLYWSTSLAPQAGAILNLAEDHLEWHGDFTEYAAAKTAIWRAAGPGGPGGTALGNLDDPWVAQRLAELGRAAGRSPAARSVGWTLGVPAPGQLGVIDGILVDRSGTAGGPPSGSPAGDPVELLAADAIRPAGRHNVSNALAAAALARAYGVSASAVRDGLAGYHPEPHRNALVAELAGVRFVDDSKATNPHAALASLLAYPRVVWIAGGQLKGVCVEDLVGRVADRLAGAVLLGVDRARLAESLARNAPDVPVVDVSSTKDGAMRTAVLAAARLARPGDTVLLAPAAASLDMFASYARRGAAFVAAVRQLTGGDLGPAGGVGGTGR